MTDFTDIPLTADPQRMINQLARLVEINVTLNSTLELDTLLQYILDTAVELLECEAVSILLYNKEQKKLQFAAATGSNPEELADVLVPLDNSIAGSIFSDNKPVVINDVAQDERHYSQVGKQTQFRVRSLVGVPMRIREEKIGVFEALNKKSSIFTYADSKLLSIIASQAAVAINNAQLVQELQEANAQLSETDEMKSRFMAVASHELRTPLGIIMGYATFLKEEAQGDLSVHAANVLNAALELRALVEDMTNMNLIYTGRRDVRPEPIALQEIIHEAYLEVASTAQAKNNHIVLGLPEEPVMVNADKKMKLVLLNLLNNAVRFTPDAGKIKIHLTTTENEAIVAVQDNGIGIAPENIERIFEQFYQVADHMTRRHGGLGLGLAIAQVLVNLHGGRIWAESEGLGQGSTFNVSLPLLQTQA
jgi:signal transduction histidine kinase